MDTLELELLIFKVFGQDKNFDKINHQFLRANQIMFDEHQFYSKLSSQEQYKLLSTILIIATATTNDTVRKINIITKPGDPGKHVIKYSLDFGFTEPEILILKGKNLLK